MYERFTDRARKVMQFSNQVALDLNHGSIDTGHMLLGLLREGQGVAAHVLKDFGLDPETLYKDLIEQVPPSLPPPCSPPAVPSIWWRAMCAIFGGPNRQKVPQTSGAKRVIEHAMAEARSLGHNYIGTEHLLLGLLHDSDSQATQLLAKRDLTLEKVRQAVLTLLKK